MCVCMYVCVSHFDHTVAEPLIALLLFLVRLKFKFLYFKEILKCYDFSWSWPIYWFIKPDSDPSNENHFVFYIQGIWKTQYFKIPHRIHRTLAYSVLVWLGPVSKAIFWRTPKTASTPSEIISTRVCDLDYWQISHSCVFLTIGTPAPPSRNRM